MNTPDDARELSEGQQAFLALYTAPGHESSSSSTPGPRQIHELIRKYKTLKRYTKERRRGTVIHRLLVFLFVREVPQRLSKKDRERLFDKIERKGSGARRRLQDITAIMAKEEPTENAEGVPVHSRRDPDIWGPEYPFKEDSELSCWNKNYDTAGDMHELHFVIFDELA